MAIITEAALRKEADQFLAARSKVLAKSAAEVLTETASTTETSFDVFISHSIKDEKVVLGIYARLVDLGYKVYVDWIVDHKLDRSQVTSDTAEHLRTRLRQSKTLVYALSGNSTNSKWMPWELGYFDGYRSAVAILPIAKTEGETFSGQEYLGLYPHIDAVGVSLFLNRGQSSRRIFGKPDSDFPSFKTFRKWITEKSA